MRQRLLLFSLFLISVAAYADGILMSWGGKDLQGMTQERFEEAKSWPVDYIIKKNLSVDNWPDVYLLALASKQKKDSVISRLIEQLPNAAHTQLKQTSRLIIWERIITKDILFEGKGFQVDDDLFSVAGRANWMLRTITQKNFGSVKPASSAEELSALKARWLKWKNGEAVDEYKSPYESEGKSLNEIHSLEAFEAIILSLEATPEKEALIKNCLKRIYNLDELPNDPSSPAMFCSPDSYSTMYLSSLSGIKDRHDYAWWKNWWIENKAKLAWDKQKTQFVIQ